MTITGISSVDKYKLSFKNAVALLKYMEEHRVQFIDCNFTDLYGRWHHVTQHVGVSSGDIFKNGVVIDGTLISSLVFENNSSLLLKPDITKVSYDPFAAQKTVKVFCNVCELTSGIPYVLDSRDVVKKARAYLKESMIGDSAYFGFEIEFFVFDDVKVVNTPNEVGYYFGSEEDYHNKGRDYTIGNMGHRPHVKGGYLVENPMDSLSDIRSEMLSVIETMGVNVDKHYHCVAPSQCCLDFSFFDILEASDNVQISKYAIHNVAHSYGKSATFMPKPLSRENGSAMRITQAILKNGDSVFSGSKNANLSDEALYYVGGILKHSRALNVFTNPTTNSYKRFSGKEGECLSQYSIVPSGMIFVHNDSYASVEACFLYPTAHPYLAFSAMLMAGIDGIKNKIQPSEVFEENNKGNSSLFASSLQMCGSLRQALDSLSSDKEFLLRGGVFTDALIESYIAIKEKEIEKYESVTQPVEVDMYYSS